MSSDFPHGLKSVSCWKGFCLYSALSEHQVLHYSGVHVFVNTFVDFPDVQRFLKSGQGFCLDLISIIYHC